jgi:hypothetical protein
MGGNPRSVNIAKYWNLTLACGRLNAAADHAGCGVRSLCTGPLRQWRAGKVCPRGGGWRHQADAEAHDADMADRATAILRVVRNAAKHIVGEAVSNLGKALPRVSMTQQPERREVLIAGNGCLLVGSPSALSLVVGTPTSAFGAPVASKVATHRPCWTIMSRRWFRMVQSRPHP